MHLLASSYLDREVHTLGDSSKQSAPRQSYHCPYSTWKLAGSLLPGYKLKKKTLLDSRKKIIALKKMAFGVNLPGIILDVAQGQTEGHVSTQLLRRSHESLQVILQTSTQGGDWHVTQRSTFSSVHCSLLTVKYCMISGLLLDLSSTSVNTSNTSVAGGVKKNKICISHYG